MSKAVENIRANLSIMARKGVGSESEIEPTLSRIKTTTSMDEAVKGTDEVNRAMEDITQLTMDLGCSADNRGL